MKRNASPLLALAFLCALLCPLVLLCGCSGGNDSDADSSPGTIALKEWRTDEEFKKAAAAIEEGELPNEMRYYAASGPYEGSGSVFDASTIKDFWETSCDMRITPELAEVEHTNDDISFLSFTWSDGNKVTFIFHDSGYYQTADYEYYALADEGLLQQTLKKAHDVADDTSDVETNREPAPTMSSDELDVLYKEYVSDDATVEAIVASEGGIVWDLDGDGSAETYWFTFSDNGDEAPSVMEVSRSDSAREFTYIDRCYGIVRGWAVTEGDEHFLLIAYQAGDYYSHSAIGVCRLMDDGQKLVVDYPVVDE